ncbi:hypothetical protein [Glutamicibacter sp. NPDC087344]|jgi:hypothetical protein|uniref:hypothetical protein n=1 Tax=Glutamicibacter sp. NPDC087344 TaxID=3363994 RepID=UPI0038182499
MNTVTSTKFSVVLDDAGAEIARRAQTPKRRYTHALIRKAESTSRVQQRHTTRLAADTPLAEILSAELEAAPTVRRAGAVEAAKIMVQPPVPLRPLIDAVYASRDDEDSAVAKYREQMCEALAAAEARIIESRQVLAALVGGTYEPAPAEVLKFVGSRAVAQQYLNAVSGSESSELLGLAIVHTVEMDA